MPILDVVVPLAMSAMVGLAGRWLQLHPEKIFGEGHFINEKSWRSFLAGIAVMGSFMVFVGTTFSLRSLLSVFTFRVNFLEWLAVVMSIAGGYMAAAYVRREVRSKPPHVSKNPYGWWP